MYPNLAGVRRKKGMVPFPVIGCFLSSGDAMSVVFLLPSASGSLLPAEIDSSELEDDDDGSDDGSDFDGNEEGTAEGDKGDEDDAADDSDEGEDNGTSPPKICILTLSASSGRSDGLDK